MLWTKERIDFLSSHESEGKSAAEIADLLGDVTRNAVLGKLWRLGIRRGLQKSQKRTRSVRGPSILRKKVRFFNPEPCSQSCSGPLQRDQSEDRPFLDIDHDECKWLTGVRNGTHYACGRPSDRGAYCSDHASLAYRGHGPAMRPLRVSRNAETNFQTGTKQ